MPNLLDIQIILYFNEKNCILEYMPDNEGLRTDLKLITKVNYLNNNT